MSKIVRIEALQILDSRGNPTVMVKLNLENNIKSIGFAPSGASTGSHEVLELRDNAQAYRGKGVLKAIENINNIIAPNIIGKSICDWRKLDEQIIGLDKFKLGSNAILPVSMAILKAAAKYEELELYNYLSLDNKQEISLPVPLINLINGGAHADNSLIIQEFMIVPVGFTKFSEAIRASSEVFYTLKKVLKDKRLTTLVGDEGGFAPNLNSHEEAIEILLVSIKNAGYVPEKHFYISIDVAASEFFNCGMYDLSLNGERLLNGTDLLDIYKDWTKKYPIFSIEDPFHEDDWENWQKITSSLNENMIVGDDLFATNIERLQKGIKTKAASAVLVKMNQIGTLSETIDVIAHAKKNKFATIISHRSGETEDTTIADIAVGMNAMMIKTGSLCRSERVAKYNRLLEIEQELGDKAIYSGEKILEHIKRGKFN